MGQGWYTGPSHRYWAGWQYALGKFDPEPQVSLSGWGGGSCAMLKPPTTGPEWASRRGSWVCRFQSVAQGREAAAMHRVKVWGARDIPNGRTLYWYATPSNANLKNCLWWGATWMLKYASFRSSEPVPWAYLWEDLFQSDQPEQPFHQAVIQESEI